jgi:hypothetical protein
MMPGPTPRKKKKKNTSRILAGLYISPTISIEIFPMGRVLIVSLLGTAADCRNSLQKRCEW